MTEPRDLVRVQVEYFDGQAEGDVGHPYYVASSEALMFTTDGATFEILLANIRACVALALEDSDSVAEYNVRPDARVELVMVLAEPSAETA